MDKRFANVLTWPGMYTIETDLTLKVKDDRDTRWVSPFGVYKENKNRLVYVHDICSLDGSSIQRVIDYCRKPVRPAFKEVFPEVPIIDVDNDYRVLKTLYKVDLTGILTGLMEHLKERRR